MLIVATDWLLLVWMRSLLKLWRKIIPEGIQRSSEQPVTLEPEPTQESTGECTAGEFSSIGAYSLTEDEVNERPLNDMDMPTFLTLRLSQKLYPSSRRL